jgi:hypothetical protein
MTRIRAVGRVQGTPWVVCGLLVLGALGCGPSVPGWFNGDSGVPQNGDGAVGPTVDASPTVDADDTVVAPPDAPPGCELEMCGDGLDNDCNGLVDDTCVCEPTATQDCYSGPKDTRHVGICKDGTSACSGDSLAELGTWGPCVDETRPGTEVCDAASLDEDCDGTANEDCDCVTGSPPVACGVDEGECVAGQQECIDGKLGPCMGATGPTDETCNNLDDDCDSFIDDNLLKSCGSDIGACSMGTSKCVAGNWEACDGQVDPIPEVCNGSDDNCNDQVDDGIDQKCGSDVGACQAGTSYCKMAMYGPCEGEITPKAETCNTLDDDCDELIDEDLTRPCGTDVGVCVSGTETCIDGKYQMCSAVGGGVESCNGLDDDCNGKTDEGCSCLDGTILACGSDVGECVAGTQICASGVYGPCNDKGPVKEICANGLDDDCDGKIDEIEECPVLGPPVVMCPADIMTKPLATVKLIGTGSDPDGGVVTYQWTVTTRPSGSTSQPSTPTSSTTSFFVDLAGTYTITLTVTDDEGNKVSCIVTITAIPDQDLHVELVWDQQYGDADLHLTRAGVTPSSAWYTGNDCFFANQNAAWPPNGPGGNATLDIDDMAGYGPENINITDSPVNGTYEIGVAYYCSYGLAGKGMTGTVAPGDGPSKAIVKVYCAGSLIATYENIALDKTGRFVDVASVSWPGCTGKSVGGASWTALVQPVTLTSPIHCRLNCLKDADCGGGEKCGPLKYCILD